MTFALDTETYLGPGRVLRVEGGNILVEVGDRKAWTVMAAPYQYEPAEQDILLVVGREESWYAIGVLHGKGRTSLVVPGDLTLAAPRGRIDLVARDGVLCKASRIKILADQLEVAAEQLCERFGSVFRRIRDALRLRAKSVTATVEQTHRLRAGKIVQRARGDVKIDGRKIHLG